MSDKKKEIRKEYIKLQDELNSFTEYYSTDADGWEDGMILNSEDKKEYEELKNKIAELKLQYKTI